MEVLGKLFGGTGIVKMLRLFLFNPEEAFEVKDIIKRTRTDAEVVRNELMMLQKIKFIRRKSFFKEVEQTKPRRRSERRGAKKTGVKRKRVFGWTLDPTFPYLTELQNLLIGSTPVEIRDIAKRFRRAGNIKAVVVAGIFVQDLTSRLDILIVGDNVKMPILTAVIKDMEAEVGRELRYALFSTNDFRYRVSMYDKLIRDLLDYPHETVVDRIGLPTT